MVQQVVQQVVQQAAQQVAQREPHLEPAPRAHPVRGLWPEELRVQLPAEAPVLPRELRLVVQRIPAMREPQEAQREQRLAARVAQPPERRIAPPAAEANRQSAEILLRHPRLRLRRFATLRPR